MRHIHGKIWLYSELVILMIVLPSALYLVLSPRLILPLIWLTALYCHMIYRVIEGVPTRVWWGAAAVTWENLRPILRRFVVCAALLAGATWALAPGLLFGFVRTNPAFWLLVMMLYPVLSVVPQEIIFRSFFFARYPRLFTTRRVMVVASGVTFGLAHLVFHNWVAPLLCMVGGMLFAQTYYRHRSLMLVAIEHALYGDFIFTLGLGRYFYHGAVGAH
jgi:membrane protease YdiL (CAAX protease family)